MVGFSVRGCGGEVNGIGRKPVSRLVMELEGLQPNLGWVVPLASTWPSQRDPIETAPMGGGVEDLYVLLG